jgi:hypothetical protein
MRGFGRKSLMDRNEKTAVVMNDNMTALNESKYDSLRPLVYSLITGNILLQQETSKN